VTELFCVPICIVCNPSTQLLVELLRPSNSARLSGSVSDPTEHHIVQPDSRADTVCVGAAQARPTRLVGRRVEKRLLADVVKATVGGRPCAVVLHGEAGAGKTQLVREVCAALGADFRVLWGT
jgi:hypothetical protein